MQLLVDGVGQLVAEAKLVRAAAADAEDSDGDRTRTGGEEGPMGAFEIAEVGGHEAGTSEAQQLQGDLLQSLRRRRWSEAYATWRQLPRDAQQSAARRLVGGLVALKGALLGEGGSALQLQHDALRTLSVLAGVPQASGAIAALLRSDDPLLTAFADEQLQVHFCRAISLPCSLAAPPPTAQRTAACPCGHPPSQ